MRFPSSEYFIKNISNNSKFEFVRGRVRAVDSCRRELIFRILAVANVLRGRKGLKYEKKSCSSTIQKTLRKCFADSDDKTSKLKNGIFSAGSLLIQERSRGEKESNDFLV